MSSATFPTPRAERSLQAATSAAGDAHARPVSESRRTPPPRAAVPSPNGRAGAALSAAFALLAATHAPTLPA